MSIPLSQTPVQVVLFSAQDDASMQLAQHLQAQGLSVATLVDIQDDDWLPQLAQMQPEMVVTALALPGISGVQVLRQIQQQQPQALRVATLSYDDEDLAMRAIGLAHNFVQQPVNPSELLNLLDKFRTINRRLQRPELRKLIGGLTSLPSPPKHSLRIIQAMADPNCHAGMISELITADPVLTAKLLQLSNSALYSNGRPVESVAFAINRLGLKQIRNLVLAAELYSHQDPKIQTAHVQQQAILASWLASRLIADRLQADLASTAALLTGVAALLTVPDEPLCDYASKVPALRAEAAAYLLRLWNLPESLIEPVAFHMNPRLGGAEFGITGAVHVAHCLSHDIKLDELYLESTGMTSHMPRWLALINEVSQRE